MTMFLSRLRGGKNHRRTTIVDDKHCSHSASGGESSRSIVDGRTRKGEHQHDALFVEHQEQPSTTTREGRSSSTDAGVGAVIENSGAGITTKVDSPDRQQQQSIQQHHKSNRSWIPGRRRRTSHDCAPAAPETLTTPEVSAASNPDHKRQHHAKRHGGIKSFLSSPSKSQQRSSNTNHLGEGSPSSPKSIAPNATGTTSGGSVPSSAASMTSHTSLSPGGASNTSSSGYGGSPDRGLHGGGDAAFFVGSVATATCCSNRQMIPLYVEEEKDHFVQMALHHRYHCRTQHFGAAANKHRRGPGGARVCECLDDVDGEEFQNSLTRAVTALDRSGNDCFAAGDYEQAMIRYERALLFKRTTLNSTVEEGEEEDCGDGQQHQKLHLQQPNGYPIDPHSAIYGVGTPPPGAKGSYSSFANQPSSPDEKETAEQKANIMASVATSINNMTYLKQRAGLASSEETMASYLKSLQIKREILGKEHLSVGKTLNNIGSVFYLRKEYEPALAAYKEACRIMEDKLGSDHCDVGTVMSNIGDVYYATGHKDDALKQYRAALGIRWVRLGREDPKVIRLMRQIAALETGDQPERDDDEVSLSEDWESEHLGDGSDRLNDSALMASVQTLSYELKEDMKYFDLLEREMAISMVKDKMRIFREMRELYTEEDDEDGGVGFGFVVDEDHFLNSFDEVDGEEEGSASAFQTSSSAVAAASTTEAGENTSSDAEGLQKKVNYEYDNDTETTSPPTLDQSSDGDSIKTDENNHHAKMEATAGSSESILTLSSHHAAKSALGVKSSTAAEIEDGEGRKALPDGTATKEVYSVPDNFSSNSDHVAKNLAVTAQSALTCVTTTKAASLSTPTLTPTPSRTPSERNLYKTSPSPCLSVEQRKEALVTVRNRLAQLRAERSSFSSHSSHAAQEEVSPYSSTSGGDCTLMRPKLPKAPMLEIPKTKSYMRPTYSSATKSVISSPTRNTASSVSVTQTTTVKHTCFDGGNL